MEFVEILTTYARQTGCELSMLMDKGRHSRNLLLLTSRDRALALYLNESELPVGFWGMNPNQIARISGGPFLVLFLKNADRIAYIATPKDVESRAGRLWKQATDGDFKIHENARIVGIARLSFEDAADFLCSLVHDASEDTNSGYVALARGTLGADGVAEFLVRALGRRKAVVRVGKSHGRVVDLMAGLAAWVAALGDTPATVLAPLLPIIANYIEILSDDDAIVVRVLAESSASGTYMNEESLLKAVDALRKERNLPRLSTEVHQTVLQSLERKGCIAGTFVPPRRWRLNEFTL